MPPDADCSSRHCRTPGQRLEPSRQIAFLPHGLQDRFDPQIEQRMEKSTTQPDDEKHYCFHPFLLDSGLPGPRRSRNAHWRMRYSFLSPARRPLSCLVRLACRAPDLACAHAEHPHDPNIAIGPPGCQENLLFYCHIICKLNTHIASIFQVPRKMEIAITEIRSPRVPGMILMFRFFPANTVPHRLPCGHGAPRAARTQTPPSAPRYGRKLLLYNTVTGGVKKMCG